MQQLINTMQFRIRRRMQHNHHTPNQTRRAPHSPQHPQPLLQEIAPQHRPNKYTECPQRSDEDRGREGVGAEIADFPNDHGDDAAPPDGVAQVGVAVAFEAVFLRGGVEAFFGDYKGGADAEGAGYG